MIVVVPLVTEVTRPEVETVTTAASDVAHVTQALLIVAPFWSLTVAVSCSVAPKDEKLRLVADSVIDVANDGAPCNFPVVGLSHAASKSTAESRMYRICLICGDARKSRQRSNPPVGTPPY